MPEEIKEIIEKKVIQEEIFNIVFNDGEVKYEDYKKYFTEEDFKKLVDNAKYLANIYEESWGFDE